MFLHSVWSDAIAASGLAKCSQFVTFELIGSHAEHGRQPAAETADCRMPTGPIRTGVPLESDFGIHALLLLQALESLDVSLDGPTAQVSCVKAIRQHDLPFQVGPGGLTGRFHPGSWQ
ncbi:MAG: hypothetical protein J2P23_08410 [Microlunatus sp.]|nr:hypothetical protein [Microlunatus sp.]